VSEKYVELLKSKMSEASYAKLSALENARLIEFIGEYVELMDPQSVYFCDDSEEDAAYIRGRALEKGEEHKLARDGQTVHWDGYGDQARDKANTRFMVHKEKMQKMGNLNTIDHAEGLAEIKGIAKGIMKGKECIVKLFCECPTHSKFSIACAQITDSYYVAHSEDILYRPGYDHFMKMENEGDFFRFVHSAGELDDRGCTVNLKNRRIYQDLENEMVFSMNAQYAGNSVGLKKHSMRLAIQRSGREGWLCEHMFINAIHNHKTGRKTYFCGAFPSACGKTATAMIPGETVVGDDIAYFKVVDGQFRAANVERGIFGIIKDVNAKDDPVIFDILNQGKEMIFSNVLVGPDNNPYWLGMGVDAPKEGKNHSGAWTEGKKDANGKEVTRAHPNSRYTIRLDYLANLDPAWNDKEGVEVGAIVYGGRDSDTCVPVEMSESWEDGIVVKACTLESETTAATLGAEGVRSPQPMANLDFISYPIGQYFQNNIDFVKALPSEKVPPIFAVNYFLLDENKEFCTSKLAKKVWLHWAEMAVHGEVETLKTPTGLIPKYDLLKTLFKELLDEDYSEEDYSYQFSFRCTKWIEKLQRAVNYYKENVPDCPEHIFKRWQDTIARIEAARDKYGDVIKPGVYEG
jgi:phosphoenolpyruvate carboxykinase (GTP)